MPTVVVKTVSCLVAVHVLEYLKLQGLLFNVVEFEQDEVFLTNTVNTVIIRVSRTDTETGEIVVEKGGDSIKKVISSPEVQNFCGLFGLPAA